MPPRWLPTAARPAPALLWPNNNENNSNDNDSNNHNMFNSNSEHIKINPWRGVV